MSEKEICVTLYNDDIELAKKRCPQGYHIEYTRNSHLLYVLDGYCYDMENDFCVKDKE
ncbi:MAG: hypothetical protein K2G44_02170 [Clostridia bacterium]|nr:hypothetical protein [Clostridia bacterium]